MACITFVGSSTFANWYGYIPAELHPLMTFYKNLGIMYLLTGLLWLFLCMSYFHDLLRLQFWIGVVAILGILSPGY